MERIRKFSDPPLTVCPQCGGELEQLLSAPAVQFKGAGWYVTDYARKGSGGGGRKDGKSTGESGSKGSGETGSSGSTDSSSEASKPGTSGGSEKK